MALVYEPRGGAVAERPHGRPELSLDFPIFEQPFAPGMDASPRRPGLALLRLVFQVLTVPAFLPSVPGGVSPKLTQRFEGVRYGDTGSDVLPKKHPCFPGKSEVFSRLTLDTAPRFPAFEPLHVARSLLNPQPRTPISQF